MSKRISFIFFVIKVLSDLSCSAELPNNDPRMNWVCVYPYTETTCQSVLLSWAEDHDMPWETIFTGVDCSGCEINYETDHIDQQHLTFAECKNRFGARFTSKDLIAPIIRYRQSNEQSPGWSVTSWSFRPCFQTWQCSQYCSLTQYPPKCIQYRSTNWGLYQPTVYRRCEESASEAPTSDPEMPFVPNSLHPRDNTWTPVE